MRFQYKESFHSQRSDGRGACERAAITRTPVEASDAACRLMLTSVGKAKTQLYTFLKSGILLGETRNLLVILSLAYVNHPLATSLISMRSRASDNVFTPVQPRMCITLAKLLKIPSKPT